MSVVKRLIRSDGFIGAMAGFGALYIRFVLATSRRAREVEASSEAALSGEKQAVLAFWHSRSLLLPAFKPPGRAMSVLVSPHDDARISAAILTRFGIRPVLGSTTRGALGGTRGILGALGAGGNVSITPDGPRGPARIASRGIAQIARKTGLPVLPVAVASRRGIRLGSWDRFMIPLPFSRIAFVVGAPIAPGEADEETVRLSVERALDAATDRADDLAGSPRESTERRAA